MCVCVYVCSMYVCNCKIVNGQLGTSRMAYNFPKKRTEDLKSITTNNGLSVTNFSMGCFWMADFVIISQIEIKLKQKPSPVF